MLTKEGRLMSFDLLCLLFRVGSEDLESRLSKWVKFLKLGFSRKWEKVYKKTWMFWISSIGLELQIRYGNKTPAKVKEFIFGALVFLAKFPRFLSPPIKELFFLLVSAFSSPRSFLKIQFLHFRDLTLHQNRWHCDCHLLALHNWLQNFTVPNSVEPRCHSPPRLISEPIKALAPTEFACIPKVSPTSMYLEVIEGKNMSLVCTIEVWILIKDFWAQENRKIFQMGVFFISNADFRHLKLKSFEWRKVNLLNIPLFTTILMCLIISNVARFSS